MNFTMLNISTLKRYSLDIENKLTSFISLSSEDEGLYVIPVVPESSGEDIKVFSPVGHRGFYESLPDVHSKLLEYAHRNGLVPHAHFRNMYMEGPPTHGNNKEAYMTQVALPIKAAYYRYIIL